jgi:DNA (cytosine-5)-methyltransferase 1
MRTVAFCEIEPFCRAVLRKHWPHVPCYDDVRSLTSGRLAADGISVDVICGGFPCQDISVAGRRAGMEGTRSGLWSEIIRLYREIRPRILIVENVAGLLAGPSEQPGGWFGRILGDLAESGCDAEWHCIPASSVGAPHSRDRVWLLAYPQQEQRVRAIFDADDAAKIIRLNQTERREDGVRSEMGTESRSIPGRWMDQPDPIGMADGVSDWSHRLGACGNAVVPQIPEIIGRAILAQEGADEMD